MCVIFLKLLCFYGTIQYTSLLLFFQYYTATGIPYFSLSVVQILKNCLATPHIAQLLSRFPVIHGKEFRYTRNNIIGSIQFYICYICREIYHALHWRFFYPYGGVGQIFVGDSVRFPADNGSCIGHIVKLFMKVCDLSVTYLWAHTILLTLYTLNSRLHIYLFIYI